MKITKTESRQFWLTDDLLSEVKRIQLEHGDERPAHTVRRLLREALKTRALAKKGDLA